MTLLDSALGTSTTVSEAAPRFVDRASGVRFEFHTPYARPDLWMRYLDGALETYRAYGVEAALEFNEIRSGLSTTLFVVGISPTGEVVAGARFLGPILNPGEAHVSAEFAGSTGQRQVQEGLTQRIPEGVIEFKGCWAQIDHPQGRALSNAIARSLVHAMEWLGVRYACCSAADHAARRWEGSGGRVMAHLEPIPYPSEKYRTTLLWWDAERIGMDADPNQWSLIQQERIESADWLGALSEPLTVL